MGRIDEELKAEGLAGVARARQQQTGSVETGDAETVAQGFRQPSGLQNRQKKILGRRP